MLLLPNGLIHTDEVDDYKNIDLVNIWFYKSLTLHKTIKCEYGSIKTGYCPQDSDICYIGTRKTVDTDYW